MKKLVTFLASCMLLGAFAFADGYMNANDLEPGEITSVKEIEDGFVLKGSAEKNLTVEIKPVHKSKAGEEFTQCVKLNGSGNADYRSISFPAKAGETVTILGTSGSKTETRPLRLTNASGEVLKEMPMGPDGQAGTVCSEGTFKVPADGVYTVFSKKSGINIYYIGVGN